MFGEDSALVRLKQELKTAREQKATEDREEAENQKKTGEWTKENEGHNAARIARVHTALRSWLESRLPVGRTALAVKSSDLEAAMSKELVTAGIAPKESSDSLEPLDFEEPGFDSVTVVLEWKPEAPDILFATAGIGVRCGEDEAVYGYRFDANGWARVIDDHPVSDWGYGYAKLELSEPDYQGRRLLLIRRASVQCASFWMNMTYSVYRTGPSPAAEPLLSG